MNNLCFRTDGSHQQFRVPYGSGPMPGGPPSHNWGSGSSDSHAPFQQRLIKLFLSCVMNMLNDFKTFLLLGSLLLL
jgi:hypothetical protein